MALKEDIAALIAKGAKPHEIKQALRAAEDEQQLSGYSEKLPDLPLIPEAKWQKLKKALTTRGGPTNRYELLVQIHGALDADDQPEFWRALFGLVAAVWADHPGHRR
jgi:hypothetical protein